jgi:DNA-binding winged helix-turn-helix (wHTH) protein/TolB-like protein
MNAVRALRFKGFTLDASAGTLTRGGKRLVLRPQPLKVLAYLAERSGELVTNRELIESCWENAKQTHINSLAQCVKAIRDALGETEHEIIRTVHGRGYVFAAPVSAVPAQQQPAGIAPPPQDAAPADPPPAQQGPAARAQPLRFLRARPAAAAALAAAALAAVVLLGSMWAIWNRAGRPVELTMAAVPSIAVLPIKAISDDEADKRDADTLTNEIETELSRAPRGYTLRIRSAPGYTAPIAHPATAGRELGVRYLALGTARREGETRLVNVQLIEAESGRSVWAEPFGFKPAEPGAQNGLATRIARMLGAEVLSAEVRLPLPAQPQANHFAMLGRALLGGEGGAEINRKAMDYFDKARALDPNSIPALLGYGRIRVNQVLNRWVPPQRYKALLDEAEPAITRAANLDPFDPAVHVLRSAYLRALGNDAEAIAEGQRAVDLRPNYPLAHGELGRATLETGRAAEAIAHIEEALRLSPGDPYASAWYYWAGMAEAHAGNYRKAVERLLQARGAKRGYPNTLVWLAIAYAGLGDWEKARFYLEQHRANFPKFSIAGWRVAVPQSNAAVTEQRLRLEALLRRLGAPETPPDDKAQTGLVR